MFKFLFNKFFVFIYLYIYFYKHFHEISEKIFEFLVENFLNLHFTFLFMQKYKYKYKIISKSTKIYTNPNIMSKKVYLGMIGDVIHPGLINIINEGAKYGDLIVGLYTDQAIIPYKKLPYLSYEQRKKIIENIKGVSEVVAQNEWSYTPNLQRIKPDFMIHGDNWKQGADEKFRTEAFEIMQQWGGKIIEIPYTKGIDQTSMLDDATKCIGTTPEIRLKSLRRLLQTKKLLRFMEVHSGISGLIVENIEIPAENNTVARFDGMWSSSLTDSADKGKPDIEAVDLTNRMQGLTNILECTTKPIIFDGDTGGIAEHFAFTVRTLERNGISAVIIEDKTGLKKNSLFGTEVKQELATKQDFCNKIITGKKAQITQNFMIIARIEELIAGKTIQDALEMAFASVEAGADGIMIHSKEKHGNDIKEFCQKFRTKYSEIPLILVPTTYNHIREDEFQTWGANIIIYANHLLRAAYPAMVNCAKSILKNSRSLEADEICMPIKNVIELIPGAK